MICPERSLADDGNGISGWWRIFGVSKRLRLCFLEKELKVVEFLMGKLGAMETSGLDGRIAL